MTDAPRSRTHEDPVEGPHHRAHPQRHESSSRQPVTRRKLWAAGNAIITMFIGLGLATLLNANALLDTAEGLELDTVKRDLAVGVMEPIQTVSEFLHLTSPRERLDSALGKEDIGAEAGEDPFAEFSAEAPVPDGDESEAPTPTTQGPTNSSEPPAATTDTVTAEDPLLLWVAGDSLSFEYGKAVIRAAADDELVNAVPEVTFQVATGLSRPDVFSWPRALADGMAANNPDVVVFMVGSNDDQGVTDPDGVAHSCCDSGWRDEYRRRVGAVMDQVTDQGRTLVYVNVPIMGGSTGSRNPNYETINSMIESEAQSRPGVVVVDAYALFQNPDGNYSQYLDGEKVRADDQVHFERAGGDRLSGATLDAIRAAFGIEDDKNGNEEPAPSTSSSTGPSTPSSSAANDATAPAGSGTTQAPTTTTPAGPSSTGSGG